MSSSSRPRPQRAFPNSQSVRVTTFDVLSNPLLSSACSIVCVAILPSESNEKMNNPEKSSPLFRLNIGLSPPSKILSPRLIPPFPFAELPVVEDDAGAAFLLEPSLFPIFFSVFHLTTSFSSPRPDRSSSWCGVGIKPVRTIRSETTWSLTLPTMGTQPHATGAVQSAAL